MGIAGKILIVDDEQDALDNCPADFESCAL